MSFIGLALGLTIKLRSCAQFPNSNKERATSIHKLNHATSLVTFDLNDLLYKDESMCVCVCVCITLKFGMGSSFHPGSASSQRAIQNVSPRPRPQPRSWPHPLLLLSFLDQSARDYFKIVLGNSPVQCRVAYACIFILIKILIT
jgi:hypothetical protein